jgi:hypothetical protein
MYDGNYDDRKVTDFFSLVRIDYENKDEAPGQKFGGGGGEFDRPIF